MEKEITKIIITIIICITIISIVGIITYGIVINEIYETPYEQCLKTCSYSDKIHCSRVCTEEIGKVITELSKDLIPLITQFLEEQKE